MLFFLLFLQHIGINFLGLNWLLAKAPLLFNISHFSVQFQFLSTSRVKLPAQVWESVLLYYRSTTGFFLWASGHSHAKAYYYLLFEIVIFAFSILTYTTIWNVFRNSTEKFQRLCGDGGGKCEAKKKQLKMYSIFLIITSFLVCNIVPGIGIHYSMVDEILCKKTQVFKTTLIRKTPYRSLNLERF